MEPQSAAESAPQPAPEPSLSFLQRLVAVFARPASAWTGLRTRQQWWFPLLILVLLSATLAATLHQRAVLPMMSDRWEQAVADGQMTGDQMQKMEEMFAGPAGLAMSVVPQVLILPLIYLLTALVIWLGAGFILGRPLTYRLGLEVACWSGLVTIPSQLLTAAIAWSRETVQGVHVGFGILLPQSDVPSKLQTGLGVVLDAIGPLSIWWLVVAVLGAAALSGAPRKNVAWVLGALYLVLVLVFAGVGAFFSPAT